MPSRAKTMLVDGILVRAFGSVVRSEGWVHWGRSLAMPLPPKLSFFLEMACFGKFRAVFFFENPGDNLH